MKDMIFVGISAGFMHPDPQRNLFKTKTVTHCEIQMQEWLIGMGMIPVLLPQKEEFIAPVLEKLSGVILFGGADVAPESYGESPLNPEWAGDPIRDANEIAIVKECEKRKIPLLGVCRGIQILNVALGGTLYQDIATQTPSIVNHRDPSVYDKNYHPVIIEPGTFMEDLYIDSQSKIVNSVHHQAIKKISPKLKVSAKSAEDGIIEAVEHKNDNIPFFAVQWHPEWLAFDTKACLNPDFLLVLFKNKIEKFLEIKN